VQEPDFGFRVPRGYQWLVERKILTSLNSPLDPWYLLDQSQKSTASAQTIDGAQHRLVSFARRSDSDDIACFMVTPQNEVDGVALIQGWVPGIGDQIVATYDSFWEWMKSVIDDIAEVIGDD
jgi:hypothetical protein